MFSHQSSCDVSTIKWSGSVKGGLCGVASLEVIDLGFAEGSVLEKLLT